MNTTNDGDASQVEPQPQSVHVVENQPGTNNPSYARLDKARLVIEVFTMFAIIGGAWAAFSGTVKLAFVERAGTRDRDLSSSQAAIVTASQMRKERPRSSR